MTLPERAASRSDWSSRLLRWFNLRPEEGKRTLLMFAFYTITSIGLLWLEQTTIALFLEGFGAEGLPVIYIASALMGSGIGFLYSWLQNNLPLGRVFAIIAILMALPLILFRVGLDLQYLGGAITLATVFLMRLWIDAEEILSDLNSQVAANQLFNIREIKRAYPIISSGLLVGDVISGFSLFFLVPILGLKNIIIAAAVMLTLGGFMLRYLTQRYKEAFPDKPVREIEELETSLNSRRLNKSLRRYVFPLFTFFILGEVLFLVLEFQYLGELERVYPDTTEIASFLGIFSGVIGICELLTQWFISSRAVERLGVFVVAMLLPISLSFFGFLTIVFDLSDWAIINLTSAQILFFGVIILRFLDELLRYTLIAGIEPILFQPLPADVRGSVQSWVQGIAVPLSDGLSGVGILGVIWLVEQFVHQSDSQIQESVFLATIVLLSICWAVSAFLLRSSYVTLLVQGAEQGRLGFAQVDLKKFRQEIVKTLDQRTNEEDRRSCIQLLEKIDPQGVAAVVASRLVNLSPKLQSQSLQAMLHNPDPEYLMDVQQLIERKPSLDVLALALRYIWLSQPNLETQTLQPYLRERVDAVVRGTAAGLILSRGTPAQRLEAKLAIESMLAHRQERERVLGTKALQDADEDSLIGRYLPSLLQDESIQVRCMALETIGLKHLHPFYPSLIKGLNYKSTREAARSALICLGDEVLPLLNSLCSNIRQPELLRLQTWSTMAEIGTDQALNLLVQQLLSSWGATRRQLLRVLLKVPAEAGIEAVNDILGRSGVETMIEQELLFLGQLYAAQLDLASDQIQEKEGELLFATLKGMEADALDRCFLLLKVLYSGNTIQAAMFKLESQDEKNVAEGLEILDNIINIAQKQVFLLILERSSTAEKLADLGDIVSYQPMKPNARLRRLLELRHFLSDWGLACCFHLARQVRWNVTREAIIACLHHPSSFVREAVLAYLKVASPRTCMELLPVLKNDPDPIVAAQVRKMSADFGNQFKYV